MAKISLTDAGNFSLALTNWRHTKGWSQKELARRAGVSDSMISQSERGVHDNLPKAINLAKLARAFGISVDDLVRGPGLFIFGTPGSASVKAEPEGLMTIRNLKLAQVTSSPGFVTIPAHWVSMHGNETSLSVTQIQDSSMEPSILRHDLLIVKPTTEVSAGAHLILLGPNRDMLVVRRLTPKPDGTIRISCDNAAADERDYVRPEDFDVVAKIVFIVRGINSP